jgi:hypothetical protein
MMLRAPGRNPKLWGWNLGSKMGVSTCAMPGRSIDQPQPARPAFADRPRPWGSLPCAHRLRAVSARVKLRADLRPMAVKAWPQLRDRFRAGEQRSRARWPSPRLQACRLYCRVQARKLAGDDLRGRPVARLKPLRSPALTQPARSRRLPVHSIGGDPCSTTHRLIASTMPSWVYVVLAVGARRRVLRTVRRGTANAGWERSGAL